MSKFSSLTLLNNLIQRIHGRQLLSTKIVPPSATKMVDIAVNLTDPTFRGKNRKGKRIHDDDLTLVLKRAKEHGVEKIIISGTSLSASREAIKLCRQYDDVSDVPALYCTVGCHPAESLEFLPANNSSIERDDEYLYALLDLAEKNLDKVVAIGECGLDYTELKYCPKDIQKIYFEKQFLLAERTGLPMFLHSRSVGMDFVELIKKHRHQFSTGVVHSFTGDELEQKELLAMGLSLSVSGCSLKTAEQINVVKKIPLDRLMLETDAPWCDIRPTHAGFQHVQTFFKVNKPGKFIRGQMVRRRNEPANIVQLLQILSATRNEGENKIAATTFKNTIEMFFSSSISGEKQ